jgi:hypothetical protein
MKLRWIVSCLFAVAVAAGAVVLFTQIMNSLAADKNAVGIVAQWLALIPTIFATSLVVSVVLGILTLRAPPEHRRRWKTYWNIVEFVWIFGTGWSIFGLISNQVPNLQNELAGLYSSAISAANPEIETMSGKLQAELCRPRPFDEATCTALGELTSGDPLGKIWNGDAYWQFATAMDRFVRQHPDNPAVAPLGAFRDDLIQIRDGKTMREHDLAPRKFPGWIRWLNISAPLIFAFVFPLRIGRAVAAFGL